MRFKIGCAQLEAVNGDVKANLSRIDDGAGQAAKAGCRLVVFPELMTTGYGQPEAVAAMAEPIPGPVSDLLSAIARDHEIALAVGLPEREDNLRYNTMLLIGPDGKEINRYRKVHLWDTERGWATPGERFPVADLDGISTGMWICYDSRFPEAGRAIARQGGNLGLVATAWLGPADEWELAIRSRAMDNGMFVAASVLMGKSFNGVSLIVDPHGRVLARGTEGETGIVTAEIDTEASRRFMERVPLLDDVRPEVY
jgi:predicted amidohydrolase